MSFPELLFRTIVFRTTIVKQRSHELSRVFAFEALTVHGGMRASIPWVRTGVKMQR